MARDYTLKPRGGGSSSGIDFAAELNEQQYAAVTSPPGQALVIAGAGSGKTRTLIYRVAYLLSNGISPENVLLLTFTNKAAREMLDRVEVLLPLKTFKLWGGTFHSIGNRILRKHADRLGFKKNFSIMDRDDQKDLMSTVIAECQIDTKASRFPKADVLADMFSLAINTQTELPEIIGERYPYFEQLLPEIHKCQVRYREKKVETNSMDFDDLLVLTVRLLEENEDLRKHYQYRFQFVLVDEYQDTNQVQADMIDLLAGDDGNLMAVGDDAQSIYSWRGANFENILRFTGRYPGAKTFKIETNYRSAPEILSLANRSIEGNERQFKKDLQPARPSKDIRPALVALGDTAQQAAFVAQRILELRDEGVELNEMAVLYRSHFHSMEIQMEFSTCGIPFKVTSGLRFFEQAHIKDVACFIKFTVNRKDEVSFKRAARLLAGVGAVAAQKLWVSWQAVDKELDGEVPKSFSEHLIDFPVPAKAKESWKQAAYTLDELLDGKGGYAHPSNMVASICGGVYDDYMRSKFKNYDQRKQDLDQLSKYSEQFKDVDEFLAQLSLMAGIDDQPKNEEPDDEQVTLSTIHQAKGLEWRAVFVIWLAEGMFPSARTIEEGSDESLEEERRLFYVAITRAMDELYLTRPLLWYSSHSGDVLQRPSRFLEELPKELMEEWNVGGGSGWM